MVKSTRSSQKAKDEENNNGRVTRSSEKAKIKAHPNVSDTAGIRKSSREKPSKIIATSSSTQKSEQVEKGTLPAPEARRKSVRVEKMKTPSPLTRSGKTRNHSFSGPSDSKSAGSLGSISRQKLQKEKSVKQLTFEAKEVNENEEHNRESSQVKRKKMTALMYRSLFTQPKKGTLVFCIMSFFFANFLHVHSGTSFVTYPNPNVIQSDVNLMVNVKCIVMLQESS